MKKIIISLALLLSAGNIMAQTPEEKAALKEAKKEAKSLLGEAQKIIDAVSPKIQDKSATDAEIVEQCSKGLELVQKALKTNGIDEKKLGEAYKLLADLAQPINNTLINKAGNKEPLDTMLFYSNLKALTEGIHNELKYTKVVKGEYGNEVYLNGKKINLANCGVYYIYAAQFLASAKKPELALEAYESALNYKTMYPEVKESVKMPIEDAQIAYYAFHTAHDAKMYDVMDKYYDSAIQFEEGAEGTKQVKIGSYLEKGDTASWAAYLREETLKEPAKNPDYVQILLSYYQKLGTEKMVEYADAILAVDPNLYIANYGKAYAMFASEKYDEALALYKKCTEINNDSYDSWYQCGLCKYRQALELNNTISSIKNQQKAKETLEETKKLFGDAIPYFEKARECTPDDPDKWAYELKQCYSVTGDAAKASEMSKLIGD
ncbi:MAG: hypothetical protein K5672_03670 [Bacteroidaceae bacterium]|nr:hypothetical protein [Bacteroidaceae bacterium]